MSRIRTRVTRTALAVTTAAAGLFGAAVLTSSPAEAAAPACVTRPEFRAVRRGMTPDQVARIFGTAGHQYAVGNYGGYRYSLREYNACTRYGSVYVDFSNDGPRTPLVLDSKSAYWG